MSENDWTNWSWSEGWGNEWKDESWPWLKSDWDWEKWIESGWPWVWKPEGLSNEWKQQLGQRDNWENVNDWNRLKTTILNSYASIFNEFQSPSTAWQWKNGFEKLNSWWTL